MYDLHCHLLPAVDDGSKSVGQSVAVLLAFKSQGITGVCLTPHLLASEAAAGVPAVHQAAFRKLEPALRSEFAKQHRVGQRVEQCDGRVVP